MFERPPFTKCPECGGEQSFGILSVASDSYERRCKFCQFKATYFLPEVDKKVLYLDQFAVSEIFKIKKQKRRADAPHAQFWAEANELLERAIIRQQIICPASNIHRDETMVYQDGNALELAHEMMGGDTSFEDTFTIEHRQIRRHFEAYLKGQDPPLFHFDVDEILTGHRNAWLPDLHISVETDWSAFVENTRLARDKAAGDIAPLYDRWARDRLKFGDALKNELEAFGGGYLDAYFHFMAMAQAGESSGDVQKFINGALSPVVALIHEINREFVGRGTPPEHAFRETARFLNWPKNQSIPHHWIAAHLFAAIADRLAQGQKRHPSRGMLNDIKAISTYGPYVDAMFLDNECASLIEEKGVAKGIKLKAKIFCLKRSTDFLAYLQGLIDSAPQEIIAAAQKLYGEA